MYYQISSLLVPSPDAEACRSWERLGLQRSPLAARREGCRFLLGTTGHPIALDFVWSASQPGPSRPLTVVLRVEHLARTLDAWTQRGLPSTAWIHPLTDEPALWLPLADRAGYDLVLYEGPPVPAAGPHAFPLLRLDHLASVTHDLEPVSRFWAGVLDVPAVGEVRNANLVIRQHRVGDVMLELLGPAGPESNLWGRPLGPVGMTSWEVPDLDQAVALARSRGFTVPDPSAGVLPNTRITTIPGTELGGLNLQLLQYLSARSV
jgi:hypothetical protein